MAAKKMKATAKRKKKAPGKPFTPPACKPKARTKKK
jgi:hypothetical protein